jgi:SET domain-containing protein
MTYAKRHPQIIVKKSPIHRRGVFTTRSFKKGEVVLVWKPKRISKADAAEISKSERQYLFQDKIGRCFMMQEPEKFVNHSCGPNTAVINGCDVAITDIKKDEEITSDYATGGNRVSFSCHCNSKNCRGQISIS